MDGAEAPAAPYVPRDTSPTWELELLVSGAVLFALFQLPPLADDLFDHMLPRLSAAWRVLLVLGHTYSKAIVYSLIAAFVIHLVMRAYWVALVGLDSVFPRGIDWERSSTGPHVREEYARLTPPLPAVIARVDNLCSAIFAFAFLIVFLFLLSVVMAAVTGVGTTLLTRGITEPLGRMLVAQALVAVVMLVLVGFPTADRLLGKRVDPAGPWPARFRWMARWSYRLSAQWLYGPIMMTLFTNVRRSAFYPLFFLVFLGSLGAVMAERAVRSDIVSLDSYAYLPEEPGPHTASFAFYEDQQPPEEVFAKTPSIPTDVVRGPYVRLFIPYDPVRHNAALAAGCPEASPARTPDEDRRAAAVLACLARIHAVALNGKAQPGLDFRFFTQSRTGIRGIVAYLPVAGLPRGRNTITVQPAPRTSKARTKTPVKPWVVPFWV
jgi:hypothetical protein